MTETKVKTSAEKTQKLDFSGPNFANVNQGKRTTIRLANKNLILGDVLLLCGTVWPYEIRATIESVDLKRFGDLTLDEVKRDGYSGWFELRRELSACYGKAITDSTAVKVVKFKIKSGKCAR